MKTTRKVLSIILAVLLIMSFAVTALAEGETGTITITNTLKDTEYNVYKMLSVKSYDKAEGGTGVIYSVVPGWETFLRENGFEFEEDGTLKNEPAIENVPQFAKDALAFAKNPDNNISAAAEPQTAAEDDTVVKFTGLELGYYLVDSSAGALCGLDTTTPNAEINEKNDVPVVEKEIGSINDVEYTGPDGAPVNIGDVVKFEVTVTAQPGAESYVYHDEMTGLTYNNDAAIEGLTAGTDYNFKTPTDDCTFEIEFTKTYLDSINTKDTQIKITYTGTVDGTTAVTDPVKNTGTLTYGDDNHTVPSTVTMKKGHFYIKKVDGGDATKLLPGAEFELKDAKGNVVKFTATGTGTLGEDGPDADIYTHDAAGTDTLTTSERGIIYVKGIAPGTYTLTETKAPEGYNAMEGTLTVTVEADQTTPVTITVENNKGTRLPQTGGMGTTIIYIVGAVLVVGAGILLVVKKRMGSAKE